MASPRRRQTRVSTRSIPLLYLGTIFFTNLLSLVCQVVWMRKAGLVFGTTYGTFSSVLAVFLAGLAFGALWAGRRSDRTGADPRLAGKLLIALGVSTAASLWILEAGRVVHAMVAPGGDGGAALLARILVVFVCLSIPTFCIGAVFPVSVSLLAGALEEVGADVSLLYGIDTIGAALGAVLGAFLFVPAFGLRATTLLLGAGAVALGIALIRRAGSTPAAAATAPEAKPAAEPDAAAPGRGSTVWLLAAFFSTGLAAVMLETAWNRLFTVLTGTSVQSTGTVLAGFLLGIGAGSLWIRKRADRYADPRLAIGFMMLAIAVGGMFVFETKTAFARYYLHMFASTSTFAGFQFAVCLAVVAVVFIPTFAMGANFPVFVRLVSRREGARADAAGRAMFVNTIGGVCGALLAEFVLIPAAGLRTVAYASAAIYAVVAIAFLATATGRTTKHLAIAGGGFALLLWLGIDLRHWEQPINALYYHGLMAKSAETFERMEREAKVLDRQEGHYGQVTVIEFGQLRFLKNNGKTDAGTSRDMATQLLMGHIPLFLHPAPKEVVNIGVGGGFTVGGMAAHGDVSKIWAIELDPLVVDAARKWFGPWGATSLDDPRTVTVATDGRNFIDRSPRKYDVIVSEPPNIWVSGVSGLFTKEFYESARDRLLPGGLLCQWVPFYEMSAPDRALAVATLKSVFPNVRLWLSREDAILVAGMDPVVVDEARLAAKLADPVVTANLALASVEPEAFRKLLLASVDPSAYTGPSSGMNRDDRPVLEFSTGRNLYYRNKARR